MERIERRGGSRPNSGRPRGERTHAVTVRISTEAKKKLDAQANKSEYIENLILND